MPESDIRDIRALSLPELQAEVECLGERPFRTKQVWQWLWAKQVQSFGEMTNLSKGFRETLASAFSFRTAVPELHQRSGDGSTKLGFRLHDGEYVEGVLIPAGGGQRTTACISSQVGCSLGCKFCATGYMSLSRNLTAGEIVDQAAALNRLSHEQFGRGLTNIVYMGMGEPLLNYKQVKVSIERITAPEGMGMSPRRITLSTVGIAKMIRRLADDNLRIEFALSLHATNDDTRSRLMPINESNPLEEVMDAVSYFHERTGTRITFEYILFRDVNDSRADARALAGLCRRVPAKVNLIEYNPIEEADWTFSTEDRLQAFIRELEARKVIVNLRRSRGKDVDGGCGQLANKHQPAKQAAQA